MKIKNIIIALISGFILLNACELDRIPESDLSDAIYWQNENDFLQASNYLYRAVWGGTAAVSEDYFLSEDQMSDNVMPDGPSDISNGTYLPSSEFGPWGRDYRVIRAANKIIEEAQSSDIDFSILSRYVAEAKFFRAFAYHELVRRYGDVPLILKTLDTESEDLYMPRIHREVVIETMYLDLDFAAEHLPLRSELNIGKEYGRITKGTAQAFKSRVALREGTWIKYHNPANAMHEYQYHLSQAKQAALNVINNEEFSIYNDKGLDSYKYLFKTEAEGSHNTEAIFVRVIGFGEDNDVNRSQYSNQVSRGFLSTTRSLADSYLCSDGLPIDKSPLYQGQINANSEFVNRDMRMDGILVKKGDRPYIVSNSLYDEPYIPVVRSETGYFLEKYISTDSFLDHIVIRYAEVLLNYAEACFELENSISDSDLDISINLLRDRAGVEHISNSFVVSNELNMQDEIRRERRVELVLEGFRYDDLLRWKIAEVLLPKAMEGVRVFAAEYVDTDFDALNLTIDSIIIAESASNRFFDASKHYLWPLPLNQIALNENLEQNPNW